MQAISNMCWVPIMYTALDICIFSEDFQAEKTAWASVGGGNPYIRCVREQQAQEEAVPY